MKRFLFLPLLLLLALASSAEKSVTDSLKEELAAATADTSRVLLYADLSDAFDFSFPDSSFHFAHTGLVLAQRIGFKKGVARCTYETGVTLWITGNYSRALQLLLSSLELREEINDQLGISKSLNVIGIIYTEQKDYRKGLEYYFKSRDICEKIKRDDRLLIALLNIGDCYEKLNQLDSALIFELEAYELANRTHDDYDKDGILNNLGNIYSKMGKDTLAMNYYRESIPYSSSIGDNKILSETYFGMANIFKRNNEVDSCIAYSKKALLAGQDAFSPMNMMNATSILSQVYESTGENDSAFRYYKLAMAYKDSIFNDVKVKQLQTLSFNEQLRQQEIAAEEARLAEERRNNLQMFAIAIFIVTFMMFTILLSRRKTKPRIIEFTGLLALLLFFEFLSLLTHPFISEVTHDTPVLMLLISVCIAAVLVPVHHALEKLVKERLAHKIDTRGGNNRL